MKPRFEAKTSQLEIMLKEAKSLEERIQKAEQSSQPLYSNQKEGSTVGHARFETARGKVPNAQYNTNNVIPESEDVKNAGATSESSKVLDKPTQYPTAFKDHTSYRINEKGEGAKTRR